jgi:uncharacterized protein (DUF2252 family)
MSTEIGQVAGIQVGTFVGPASLGEDRLQVMQKTNTAEDEAFRLLEQKDKDSLWVAAEETAREKEAAR